MNLYLDKLSSHTRNILLSMRDLDGFIKFDKKANEWYIYYKCNVLNSNDTFTMQNKISNYRVEELDKLGVLFAIVDRQDRQKIKRYVLNKKVNFK